MSLHPKVGCPKAAQADVDDAGAVDAGAGETSIDSSEAGASCDGGCCDGGSCCDGGCDAGCGDACALSCGSLTNCGDLCADPSRRIRFTAAAVTWRAAMARSARTATAFRVAAIKRSAVTLASISTRSAVHCGGCDKPCPQANGSGKAVCRDSQCGVTCDDGQPACGINCCTAPSPNHVMTCRDGKACAEECLGVVAACSDGSKQTCASWDFESGTTEGIVVNASDTNWDETTFASTTQQAARGKRSLAIGVDTSKGGQLNLTIHLCDDKDAPFDTSTYLGMHGKMMIAPAPQLPELRGFQSRRLVLLL